MTGSPHENIVELVAKTLVKAGSEFSDDKLRAYETAIKNDSNENSCWIMESILENARVASSGHCPLCDDTGIPHVIIDAGEDVGIDGDFIAAVEEGVAEGLRRLPGRPMAVRGDDRQRLSQCLGQYEEPDALKPAPFSIRRSPDGKTRVHVLMLGGGPAIRGKTYRVFHRHDEQSVIDEIVAWAKEAVSLLGCSPCTLAVGIGRSHYEAASLMLQAMADGRYDIQSDMENEITSRVNQAGIGALGLGGDTSVLATFMKVGEQRASGVRIVCLRPCCCFEPRSAVTGL